MALRRRMEKRREHLYICQNQRPSKAGSRTGKGCRWNTGFTGRLCCHPARPGQAGELGREEPAEVQQGQGQDPAPGEEQPQAPVQAGADLLESSSVERDWECWGMTG